MTLLGKLSISEQLNVVMTFVLYIVKLGELVHGTKINIVSKSRLFETSISVRGLRSVIELQLSG